MQLSTITVIASKFGKTVIALLLMANGLAAQGESQSDMNAQAQRMLDTVDAGLNRVYKAILDEQKNNPQFIEKFRESQREWLKGTELEIEKAFPVEAGKNPREVYGSVYQSEYCELRTQIILDRIKQIQKHGGTSGFDLKGFYKDHDSMRAEPNADTLDASSNSQSSLVGVDYRFEAEERELMEGYSELSRKLLPEQAAALEASQQAWMAYRQSQNNLIDGLYKSGTIDKDASLSAKGYLILNRRQQLSWITPSSSSSTAPSKTAHGPLASSSPTAVPAPNIAEFRPNEPMSFGGMWIIKSLNGSTIVEKYRNMSGRPIKAFRVKFTRLNDFGEQNGEFETEFDTNTSFVSAASRSNQHIIKPGETIYINTFNIDGAVNDFFATSENLLLKMLKVAVESSLPGEADKSKLRFEFDKAAYAN